MRLNIPKKPKVSLAAIEFISVKTLRDGVHNRELNAMYKVAISEGFLGDYLVKHQPKATYVFMYKGSMLGFAIPRRKNENEWRVGAIYTLPALRGLGISREFLNRFFGDAIVTASIETKNASSIKMFTSCGFVVDSQPYKDDDGTILVDYIRRK